MNYTININQIGEGKAKPLFSQSSSLNYLIELIENGYISGELLLEPLNSDDEYCIRFQWELTKSEF